MLGLWNIVKYTHRVTLFKKTCFCGIFRAAFRRYIQLLCYIFFIILCFFVGLCVIYQILRSFSWKIYNNFESKNQLAESNFAAVRNCMILNIY